MEGMEWNIEGMDRMELIDGGMAPSIPFPRSVHPILSSPSMFHSIPSIPPIPSIPKME